MQDSALAQTEQPIDQIVEISALYPGLSETYLEQGLSNNRVKAYQKFMLEIAEHFGANSSVNKNYVAEIQNVLELEMELVKAALEDKSYEYMMAEDFIKLYPGFPIVFFVRARYQEYFSILIILRNFKVSGESIFQHSVPAQSTVRLHQTTMEDSAQDTRKSAGQLSHLEDCVRLCPLPRLRGL